MKNSFADNDPKYDYVLIQFENAKVIKECLQKLEYLGLSCVSEGCDNTVYGILEHEALTSLNLDNLKGVLWISNEEPPNCK